MQVLGTHSVTSIVCNQPGSSVVVSTACLEVLFDSVAPPSLGIGVNEQMLVQNCEQATLGFIITYN